ncbi:MAG: alpha/beta hydrolase [Pseudobutyrivibrio sp.]|nr:alpha/beta hydrolase [Pseudobutyrivibrio sp.]
MKKNKKLMLLCVSLVIILLGSIFASVFNGGTGVRVSRISFEAANGQLSGLLYMPKDASESNPKPTVIVTHGYLNSAEMQDANAIELSRRGFVVLALDQYDHGHSNINDEMYSDTSFVGIWFPFWVNSMHDAVAYMYEQPYVLKDEAGNGIIGVTGHSMGGFGTTMAMAMDEQEALETGVRKIYAGLTEGSDFSYTGLAGVDVAAADALGGGRTMGKVAAQYDEFFFNDPAEQGGTVRHKDYVSTPDGLAFLQQTSEAEANKWYSTSDGGKRIIYEPSQTHPWNHFSKKTTGSAIDFYQTAFADYADSLSFKNPSSQIWQLKEFFECVALVGFVILILAVFSLLIEAPFFNKSVSDELVVAPSPTGAKRIVSIVITIVAVLLPAIFFTPLMDDGVGSKGLNILFGIGLAAAVVGLVYFVISLVKKTGRATTLASCIMTVAGGLLAVVCKVPMYQNYAVFTAPGLNSIAYWTIACALIAVTIMSCVFLFLKDKEETSLASYGLVFKPTTIISGICTGLCTVVIAYLVLFAVDAIFHVDFRIWTFAFKTFDGNILPAICTYLPTFLLFYLVSTASITVNTNTEKLQGLPGYFLAIALNAGGAIIWLLRQYITLFATGVSAHPNSALSGIVLVAMVPTLSIAAIISRYAYKRTGNIWAAGVLNGVLMTTMAVANTMVAFK